MPTLLLLLKSRQWNVCTEWSSLAKESVWRFSSITAAQKGGSVWIRLVILIVWNYSSTLTVKLNYTPNKNAKFFLLQEILSIIKRSVSHRLTRNSIYTKYGKKFIIQIDHQTLTTIFDTKGKSSARIIRWIPQIQQYDSTLSCKTHQSKRWL